MGLLYVMILLVCVLISVAFYTLLERKVLGYVQTRKGPNKVGMSGIFQPFADAISLFSSEQNYMVMSNLLIFYCVAFLSLALMLMFWYVYPFGFGGLEVGNGLVYVLCISSLGVYVVLGGGWASNSSYSLLGSFRGVAQTISYEVSLSLLLIGLIMLVGSYQLEEVIEAQDFWLGGSCMLLFYMWLVSCLAETNRSPFDFAEGESELVSGFNVEYGGGSFALLFMAEYGNIIFMSFLTVFLFTGGGLFVEWKVLVMMIYFLWVRGTYVRFRYDNLMMLIWSEYLPYSLFFICFSMGVLTFFW